MTRLFLLAALALIIATSPWRAGAQELGPLIAGRSGYVNGTFVWTDYAYDDHGANADGRPGGDGAGGYPAGLENHADLIQLQIGLSAGQVAIRAILETLVDADTPVLGVAFDSDAIQRHGLQIAPNVSFRVPEKCDVTGNGLCNGQDAGATRAAALGRPSAYQADACAAFTGERFVDVNTDGTSQVTLSGLVPGTLGRLDGAPTGAADGDGRLAIAVPVGQHGIGIRP